MPCVGRNGAVYSTQKHVEPDRGNQVGDRNGMPSLVLLCRFKGDQLLVARADDRREPVGRGDDHDDVAPQEYREEYEYLGCGATWGKHIRSQVKDYQGCRQEEREEAEFDEDAPERQFAGRARVAREVCAGDSRRGEDNHYERPDVDPEHREGRGEHHAKRPARVCRHDKTE